MQAKRDSLTAIRPTAEQMATILNYCCILHYLSYFLADGEPQKAFFTLTSDTIPKHG